MDAGELEADIAFKAGADLVTVLGVAGDSTIVGAVKAAKKHGKGIVVDLIGVADKAARAKEVVALGAEFVEMHAGLDEQAEEGFTFETLLDDGKASGVPFSVAGGVKAATIGSVQEAGAAGRRRRRRDLRRPRRRRRRRGAPRRDRLTLGQNDDNAGVPACRCGSTTALGGNTRVCEIPTYLAKSHIVGH